MKKSILFLANSVKFSPETIITKGLGGSETATIYMARELASLGNEVIVICPCDAPGNYDGVTYKNINEYGNYISVKIFDVIVVLRMPDVFKENLPAKLKILWTQDAYDQPFIKNLSDKEIQKKIDKIFTVGKWQTEKIMKYYGISAEKFYISRNGINRKFYENNEYKREIGRLVYTSTPFRGLDVLLDIFPRIKTKIPYAELFIYSSMSVYGMSEEEDRRMHGPLYDKCNQPGVYLKGSIPQDRLAEELKKSYLMAYPNHFAETSCIAAIEAQAAGLPVVTTQLGALSETVINNKTGVCIPGNSRSQDYQDRFVREVVHLIKNQDRWNEMSSTAHHRVMEKYSWDMIAREWDEEFDREIREINKTANVIYERNHDNISSIKNETIMAKENKKEEGNSHISPLYREGKREFAGLSDEKDKTTISLCMIVKNEEAFLPECLRKMKPFIDQIIVIDTGSSDKTIEIAKQYGATVYNHKWSDDFSEARNVSLKHATCDWILALDADEVVADRDMKRIRELISNTRCSVFNLIQRTYENYSGFNDWVENKTDYCEGKSYPGYIDSPLVRLFRNKKGIRFSGRVHELADLSRFRGNNHIENTDIVIHHYGKVGNKQQPDKKGDLYLSIGIKKIKENPYDVRAHFDLGIQYSEKGLFKDAVKNLKRAIELSPGYIDAYVNLGYAYISLEDYDQAEFYLKKACRLCPESRPAHYNLGRLYHLKNDFKTAEALYKKTLEIDSNYINALKGMGTLYLDMKRFEEARIFLYKVFQKVKDVEIYNNLGCLEDKEGLYERAVFFFGKAVEFEPHNQIIIHNLRNIKKKLSNAGENENCYKPKDGSISLCMIVRNEEHNLVRCLNSVRDIADEIIIVDTGSTDRTIEIAKGFGAKVFNHPWEGSFSKARNYSLKYATCDWVLILDADEEVWKEDAAKVKDIVRDNNYTAISFVVRNKFKDSTQECYANGIRLFRNFNGTYYDGIVHNMIKWSGKHLDSSLSIIHHGYNESEDKMKEKFLRTTKLLKDQIKTEPHNPVPHRYLGISYMSDGMFDEAIAESKKALELIEKENTFVRDFLVSYYVISASYCEKGELKESETYALKSVELDDKFLDGFCILSFVYYNLKKYDRFLQNSEKYLTLWDSITKQPGDFGFLNSHTIGHKWKIHLLRGFYYLNNGQAEKGNVEIDKAINETTDIEDCLKLLGNFYQENNYLDKAEETYKELLNINEKSVDTLVKTGHVKFRKNNLTEAVSSWKRAVEIEPTLFDISLLICKINITQGNIEDVIADCDRLLRILNIPNNITLEDLSDLASLFDRIGKKLEEKHDIQSAETAFNICKDLKRIQPMDTVNV